MLKISDVAKTLGISVSYAYHVWPALVETKQIPPPMQFKLPNGGLSRPKWCPAKLRAHLDSAVTK